MKKLLFVLFIMMALGSLFASILLTDDFTGTVGTLLTAPENGWTAHSGAGSGPMSIAAPGLSYPSFVGSGIGNATSASGNSEDVNKAFTSTNSGSLYYAFLINTTITTTTAGYCMSFYQNSSTFHGRFWVKLVSGNVNFGLAKTTAAAVYDPTNYATGTTYLVVLKYTFNTGSTTDDAVYMWINPAAGSSEPTPNVSITTDTAVDATSISAVQIRQYTTNTNCRFDGVRVATAWTDLFTLSTPVISETGALSTFTTVYPTVPASQHYVVSGTELSADIKVKAPAAFKVSLDNATWVDSVFVTQTGGAASDTVYVRFNPALPGNYGPSNIVHTSAGATTVNKSVSGVAYAGTIDVTQALIPFTGAIVGTPTAAQTYHVTGTGLTSSYLQIRTTGPFQIMDTTNPSPTWEDTLQVLPNFDGDVDVRYNPIYAGTQSGHIIHSVPDGEAANVDVTLSGTAADPAPVLSVNKTNMLFSAPFGSSSAAQTVTITSANLTSLINIASTGAYTFSATEGGTYTNPYQITTGYNGTNGFWVKFTPPSIDTFNNSIIISSGAVGDTIITQGYGLDPDATYATDLFFSEYIEGLSNNKALEIFNGTGHSVDLSDYTVYLYANGSPTPSNTLAMTGILADNDTYVIVNSSANAGILALGDITSTVTYFNGDDAVGLYKESTASHVDIIGVIGNDPGTEWTGTGGYSTLNKTIVRKASIYSGVSVNPSGTGPTAFTTLTTEWDLYVVDTYSNLGIHTFAPGATPAAEPVILPAAGIKTGPITVSMTTSTPSGQIWYTTDGSDPTNAAPATLYSGTFQVTTTTTVKARTYKIGYAPSAIVSAAYIYPTVVANIAALRAITLPTTGKYMISGEVVLTLKSTIRNSKYIQDATGAVLIDDPTGIITTSYNLGDGITGIAGTIAKYTGMLQFTPVANPGAATSTGNVVAPTVVTLAAIDSTYQGKLVTVQGVTFPGATGNFGIPAANYQVQDASGFGWCRDHYTDLDYVGTPIPITVKNITGVILQYTTTSTMYQLVPRSLADIADGAAPDAPIEVVVSVSGTDILLNWADDATVTSWAVWASDVSPDSGFGIEPVAIVNTNSCTFVDESSSYGKRFYYVTARR